MTKIILTDGSQEFLSPGAARAKVATGEAKFPTQDAMYSTRQMVAEKPRELKPEEDKPKRKRRTKAEMEADQADCDEAE